MTGRSVDAGPPGALVHEILLQKTYFYHGVVEGAGFRVSGEGWSSDGKLT